MNIYTVKDLMKLGVVERSVDHDGAVTYTVVRSWTCDGTMQLPIDGMFTWDSKLIKPFPIE